MWTLAAPGAWRLPWCWSLSRRSLRPFAVGVYLAAQLIDPDLRGRIVCYLAELREPRSGRAAMSEAESETGSGMPLLPIGDIAGGAIGGVLCCLPVVQRRKSAS